MDRSRPPVTRSRARGDRLASFAARALRLAGDARLALPLLLLAGAWNAAAAALPDGGRLLDSPLYLALLAAILLTGLAGVALRARAAWREWRNPAPFSSGAEGVVAELPLEEPLDEPRRRAVLRVLAAAGYRLSEGGSRNGWTVAGVRRGWAPFAGLGVHLALVLLVLGAAIGTAFSSETTFSLLPGDQALLDAARPGFNDAVRLDRFEAEFGPDGRPRRLDTWVTYLHDGSEVRQQLIQVNQPGNFGGYLVHGWTYGPAVDLRVTSLGGSALLDAPVALDATVGGRPGALVDLPSVGLTVGLRLEDATANTISVAVADADGLVDASVLAPGEERRVGGLNVRHQGFSSYVTFVSRRDPGMLLLFGGAGLMVVGLAVALWLPRRRLTLLAAPGTVRLAVRGERFDQPAEELARVRDRLSAALGATP